MIDRMVYVLKHLAPIFRQAHYYTSIRVKQCYTLPSLPHLRHVEGKLLARNQVERQQKEEETQKERENYVGAHFEQMRAGIRTNVFTCTWREVPLPNPLWLIGI